MHWIAPSEKDADFAALEKRLWDAADQFRANSGLKAQKHSGPILGSSLRFAEVRFAAKRAKLEKAASNRGKGSLPRRGSRMMNPRPQFGSATSGHGGNTPFTFQTCPQEFSVLCVTTPHHQPQPYEK